MYPKQLTMLCINLMCTTILFTSYNPVILLFRRSTTFMVLTKNSLVLHQSNLYVTTIHVLLIVLSH